MIRFLLLIGLIWGLKGGHKFYKDLFVAEPISSAQLSTATAGLVEVTGQVLQCEQRSDLSVLYRIDCHGIETTVVGVAGCPVMQKFAWIKAKGKMIAPRCLSVSRHDRITTSTPLASMAYEPVERMPNESMRRVAIPVVYTVLGKPQGRQRLVGFKDHFDNHYSNGLLDPLLASQFLDDQPSVLKGYVSRKGGFVIEAWE